MSLKDLPKTPVPSTKQPGAHAPRSVFLAGCRCLAGWRVRKPTGNPPVSRRGRVPERGPAGTEDVGRSPREQTPAAASEGAPPKHWPLPAGPRAMPRKAKAWICLIRFGAAFRGGSGFFRFGLLELGMPLGLIVLFWEGRVRGHQFWSSSKSSQMVP